MALKIVHLCDVHSSKGEDIPAAFAHTLVLDGGTFAIDLCTPCEHERFAPLVAFMDAFGLLTDGVVDPREALSENLRQTFVDSVKRAPAQKQTSAPVSVQKQTPAPARPPVAPVVSESAPESPDELSARVRLQTETRERLPIVRKLLLDCADGISTKDIGRRLGLASENTVLNLLTLLRESGHADFIRQKWWAPEHVTQEMRDELSALREIVHARNAVPRVCPVDGESVVGSSEWDHHCNDVHGVPPRELLGLMCPIDGETFSTPQVLGMHGRKEHDAVHTPQLFQHADELGDSLGIIAAIRARFS